MLFYIDYSISFYTANTSDVFKTDFKCTVNILTAVSTAFGSVTFATFV